MEHEVRREPRGTPFEGTYTALEVESTTTSPTGIVVASYRVLRTQVP